MSRSKALINRQAFLNNAAHLSKLSNDRPLLMMAKANAYGHGLKEVAQLAMESPFVYGAGVACILEAQTLREHHYQKSIFLFDSGAWVDDDVFLLSDLGVTPVLTGYRDTETLIERMSHKKSAHPLNAHLKIDTGFMRNGLYFEKILKGAFDDLFHRLIASPFIKLEGIATHFCCADDPNNDFTELQVKRFTQCLDHIERLINCPLIVHMANSPALLRGITSVPNKPHLNHWTRPGIALFGAGYSAFEKAQELSPVLSLSSRIVSTKDVKKGESIGYGHNFSADNTMKMALISIGYGDGVRRSLSGRQDVLIRGKRAPIIGTISMDSLAVDVTHLYENLGPSAIDLGTNVTLLGKDGDEQIRVEDWAKVDNTIPYEILTSIAARVVRTII